MKKFLKKYGLTDEQIDAVLEAYKKDGHADATDLPEYIGKARFDEVNTAKKAAEGKVADLTKQLEDLTKGGDEAVKAAVKAKEDELTAQFTKEKEALIRDHNMESAIFKAHGKNAKAIKALIDPEKDLDEEIKRLQKDEAYLFEEDIPGGTGKHGSDKKPGEVSDKEMEAMRHAVGVRS